MTGCEAMEQTKAPALSETTHVSEKMSEKILRLNRAKETITIAEMAELTGTATRVIERTLKALKEEGRRHRIGPAKGGRWKVT